MEYSPSEQQSETSSHGEPFLVGGGEALGVGGVCNEGQQIVIQNRETIRMERRNEGVTINNAIKNFTFKGLFQLSLTF